MDLLFALAAGQVFEPIAKWATDSGDVTAEQTWALVVAGVLIGTSWIGYHGSANRSRFLVKFVNVELVKFVLDVLMVAAYFYVAAVAMKGDPGDVAQRQTRAIVFAFLLYLVWDGGSAWQKRAGSGYRRVWNEAVRDPRFPLIEREWDRTDVSRILVTAAFSVGALLADREIASWDRMTDRQAINVFVAMIGYLIVYRCMKEVLSAAWLARRDDERGTQNGGASLSAGGLVAVGLVAIAAGVLTRFSRRRDVSSQ